MRKFTSWLLIAVMLLSFAACDQTGDLENTTPVPSASTEKIPEDTTPEPSESVSHYPVTVIDQAGREVVIEEEPQTLLSSYYITTSLLMALDLDNKLVGVEDNAGFRPIYGLSNPEILELPSIGTAKELDLEGCAALSPDLAILPMKLKNSVESLEALGIPVIIVNPESQELLTEMIRLVGIATNTAETAEKLISFVAEQESYLANTLAGADMPSVYLSGNSSMLLTAGDAMYQSDMIRLAGGKNVAADITDTYWAQIDYEQLLSWDPEYIILASSAKYTVEDVLNDPNLANCTAVIHGNVYQIPCDVESWDSPVPSSFLGALWLAHILHPELMTDTNRTAITNEYYETFYHFTCIEN